MAPGYIYILFMAEMPNCLKVGRTKREPRIRAKELSKTSTPRPFRVLMEWQVTDNIAAEKAAHDALASDRVSDKREFFYVSGPEAIERVAEAIQPYLRLRLDKALVSEIGSKCNYLSEKYLRSDLRYDPPVSTESSVYAGLSSSLTSIAVSSANHLLDDSHDPSVILSILDIVDLYFEGYIHAHSSPNTLHTLFFHHIGLLTHMMDLNPYLMVGANWVVPSVLNVVGAISRAASAAIEEENKVLNRLEGN